MKLEPLNRHLVVGQCKDPRSLKKGHLVLQPGVPQGVNFGAVVAVDETNPPKDINVGNIVYYRSGQGVPVLVDEGEGLLLIHESQIVAIVREKAKRVENVVGTPAGNILVPKRPDGRDIIH